MVLIPLRGRGTRGDQVENAGFFERAGAAVVLSDEEVSKEKLEECIIKLATDGNALKAMSAASAAMGSTDAAAEIASSIVEFIRGKEQ